MNEGIAKRTVRRPFRAPHARPVSTARSPPSRTPTPRRSMARPRTALVRPSTDPTERSMPAITRTKVRPTATITPSGTWFAIVRNVARLKKRSVATEKAATRPTRTPSRASISPRPLTPASSVPGPRPPPPSPQPRSPPPDLGGHGEGGHHAHEDADQGQHLPAAAHAALRRSRPETPAAINASAHPSP